MRITLFRIAFLASSIVITACAQATPPSATGGEGGEGGSAGSTTSWGSTGGSGGTGMGGSGSGVGGGADVDPLAGIGPVEYVQGGFQAADGPVWDATNGLLLFTDSPSNKIYSLTPPATVAVFRNSSGNASGLALTPAGLLVACEHGTRRVSRTLMDQTIEDVATSYNSLLLNSPHDAIVGSDNSIYFTDPPFGLPSPGSSELGFFGIFWVDSLGMINLVADDMPTPNGIALSPDKMMLYVTDTQTAEVRAFPMMGFGQVGMGMTLMNTSPSPAGLCLDDAGNLFIATSVGIEVYRSNGSLRGTISVPEVPTSCAFGDADRKTMYITAGTSVYRVVLQVSGLP